jgi:hypothetical protein
MYKVNEMCNESVFKPVYEVEIISNFFLIFNSCEKVLKNKSTVDILNPNSASQIMDRLNSNETVLIYYDTESLNAFSKYFGDFLKDKMNMNLKKDRLHLCILNKIIMNPEFI